jgi:hypothetical protein
MDVNRKIVNYPDSARIFNFSIEKNPTDVTRRKYPVIPVYLETLIRVAGETVYKTLISFGK